MVDGGGLLVAGGEAAPLFDPVDTSLDSVALLYASQPDGRPPLRSLRLRLAIWSAGWGITARMPRTRRWWRIALDE